MEAVPRGAVDRSASDEGQRGPEMLAITVTKNIINPETVGAIVPWQAMQNAADLDKWSVLGTDTAGRCGVKGQPPGAGEGAIRSCSRSTGVAASSPPRQSKSHIFLKVRGISFFDSMKMNKLSAIIKLPDLH